MRENPEKGKELLRFDYNQAYSKWKWDHCKRPLFEDKNGYDGYDGFFPPSWETIEELCLSAFQGNLLELWLDRYTESEITELLGISRSTVQKTKIKIRDKAARVYHKNKEDENANTHQDGA